MIDSLTQAGLIRFSTENVSGMTYEYRASRRLQFIEHNQCSRGARTEKSIYRRRDGKQYKKPDYTKEPGSGWLTPWRELSASEEAKLPPEVRFWDSSDISHYAQLLNCVQLCGPMDCSLPESSAHGIFQARILEWGTISFSIVYWRERIVKCQKI